MLNFINSVEFQFLVEPFFFLILSPQFLTNGLFLFLFNAEDSASWDDGDSDVDLNSGSQMLDLQSCGNLASLCSSEDQAASFPFTSYFAID